MEVTEFERRFEITIDKVTNTIKVLDKIDKRNAVIKLTHKISEQEALEWLYSIWSAFEEDSFEWWWFFKWGWFIERSGEEAPAINPEKITPEFIKQYIKFSNTYEWSYKKTKLEADELPLHGYIRVEGSPIKYHYHYKVICDLLEGIIYSGLEITKEGSEKTFIKCKCDNEGQVLKVFHNYLWGD